MAWTTPRTWVTGELVTAAIGNTHWRDDLTYLYPIAEFLPSSATVAFSSIPQTYKHLVIDWQAICGVETVLKLQFNGDSTAANYRYQQRELLNGAANDGRVTSAGGIGFGVSGDGGGAGGGRVVINNYSGGFLPRCFGDYCMVTSTNDRVGIMGGAYSGGSPITSIQIPFTMTGIFTLSGVA